MSNQQNWRIEQDAGDYFGQQKKQLQVADRRPVIRRASDLVGPGIGAHSTRITDFNNVLAMFNGFYSAKYDALNAPGTGSDWIGTVTADEELGGVQVFQALDSGDTNMYRRIFLRNPGALELVTWGPWQTASGVWT